MKNFSQLFAGLFILLLSFNVHAQSKTGADYFEGKWNVLVKGLPNGDTKMVIVLEKKDTILTGSVQDTTGKEIAKFDKVEFNETTATVYFVAQGYDVNLVMNKKDDDHITGSMMGMFEAEGDRVKVIKLVIDSTQLESYKAAPKEEIEPSFRLEPGVLTLYAVSEKDKPISISFWRF